MKIFSHLLITSFFALFLISCTDTSIDPTLNTEATISGKVVLAQDGSGLGDAVVRLRIGGQWYEARSAGGDSHTSGDFSFAGLPVNASFYIEIVPATVENVITLANSYTFGTTVKTDANTAIDGTPDEFNSKLASNDVGLIHIYKAETTTITVKDIEDGALISGLGMWVEPAGFGTGDAKAGSISAPWITAIVDDMNVPVDQANPGVYTFILPAHGKSIGVYINSLLTHEGVQYQTLFGDQLAPGVFDNGDAGDTSSGAGAHDDGAFTDRLLTNIVAGQNIEIFLRRTSPHDLVVSFELFDEDGAAFTEAGAAIAVTETSTGNIVSAVQDETQDNRYSLMTNYRNTLTYQVANLDLTGNGFWDTAATVVFGAGNTATVNQNGEQEVNIPVTITEMSSSTDVLADVLTTSIVPGVSAEATIAFNQPVMPVGATPVQVSVNALNLTAANDGADDLAPLASVLNAAGAAGGVVLTNPVGTNFNQYSYTDNTAATVVFALPGADIDNGTIVDPFETRVDATNSIVTATLTATNASNTVYQLSIDAISITDLQRVNFTLLVKAINSDVTQVVSQSLWAQSSAAASLTDFVVDDGDFIDTPTTNLVNATSSLITAENENLEYSLANTDGLGACGTSDCVFLALNQPGAQPIGANEGVLSLVTPAAFYGTVKLVDYVVTSLPPGAGATVDTTTMVYDTQITVSSTQDEANDMQDAADRDDADLVDARGSYEYFLADPENQWLDDKNGGNTLDAVFGDNTAAGNSRVDFNGWTRGYKRTGLGYRVSLAGLGLPGNGAGSFLKSVTLDMDVVIGGVRQAGQVTLVVQ